VTVQRPPAVALSGCGHGRKRYRHERREDARPIHPAARRGRRTSSPAQLGQRCAMDTAHEGQKVHS
jgi:hypothetical protein